MATLDWQCRHAGDATLVELFVTSDVDARVEIASKLQPVWPPRRQNRPVAGWDESGFEGVVTAGEPLVLGYASPEDPVEPPATVVESEPVAETPGTSPTPETLVRELGEAGPPRDAVPTPPESTSADSQATDSTAPTADTPPSHAPHADDTSHTSHADDTSHTSHADDTSHAPHADDTSHAPQADGTSHASQADGTSHASQADGTSHASQADGTPSTSPVPSSNETQPTDAPSPNEHNRSTGPVSQAGQSQRDGQRSRARGQSVERSSGADRRTDDTAPGEAIDAWLGAVERRIETAERLAAVETAEEARAAVDAAGGIAAVRAVCEQLDADRERFERIETDRAAVGERLAAVDVPLSALERLA